MAIQQNRKPTEKLQDFIYQKIEKIDKKGNPYYILKLGSNDESIFCFARRESVDWCKEIQEGSNYELEYWLSDTDTKILQSFKLIIE